MDLHNLIMDLHNSIMDLHNWLLWFSIIQIMDIHDWLWISMIDYGSP